MSGNDYVRTPWHADVAFAKLSPDDWDDHDLDVSRVMSYLKISRLETYKLIFERGLESYLEEITQEEKGVISKDAKLALKLRELRKGKRRKKQLAKLYEEGGNEALEWAKSEGIEGTEEVIQEFSLLIDLEPWRISAANWLDETMLAKGKVKTTEAYAMAIEAGIIADSAKDRNRLMQLARRKGYISGDYGIWGLSNE